jgi:hypothetical protein
MEASFSHISFPSHCSCIEELEGIFFEPGQGSNQGLTWGPFRVKGVWGTLNNIFSLAFACIVVIFGFWPAENHPTPAKMNYSVAIFGGAIIFEMVYYFGWARKYYLGPVMEVQSVER